MNLVETHQIFFFTSEEIVLAQLLDKNVRDCSNKADEYIITTNGVL